MESSQQKNRFSERDVEEFFDQSTQTYLSFWDAEGVLHTGYFDPGNESDYRTAAQRTSEILAEAAAIDGSSVVLDVGCGCGNFLLDMARRFQCRGEGLDISTERIRFAQARLAEADASHQRALRFRQGTGTDMPYASGSFSHVVSQDALFLVPDQARLHHEIYRVLRDGGTFACTDFLQPKVDVSPRARRHVYDRVKWNGGLSLRGYQSALAEVGFEIRLARDVTEHLQRTYRVLGKMASERAESAPDAAAREWILRFAASCKEIEIAIEDGEFGWGLLVARKPERRR